MEQSKQGTHSIPTGQSKDSPLVLDETESDSDPDAIISIERQRPAANRAQAVASSASPTPAGSGKTGRMEGAGPSHGGRSGLARRNRKTAADDDGEWLPPSTPTSKSSRRSPAFNNGIAYSSPSSSEHSSVPERMPSPPLQPSTNLHDDYEGTENDEEYVNCWFDYYYIQC